MNGAILQRLGSDEQLAVDRSRLNALKTTNPKFPKDLTANINTVGRGCYDVWERGNNYIKEI